MRKTTYKWVQTFFSLVLCTLLAGCTAMLLGGGGSAGRPIGEDSRALTTLDADRQITSTIRRRYAASEALFAAGLEVSTLRGVVTLQGAVDDFALRSQAEQLAADVSGVVRVSNQIRIAR